VPYQWIDLDQDPATRELVSGLTDGPADLPVVFFRDGSHLVAPTTRELADKVGLATRASRPFYDLISRPSEYHEEHEGSLRSPHEDHEARLRSPRNASVGRPFRVAQDARQETTRRAFVRFV